MLLLMSIILAVNILLLSISLNKVNKKYIAPFMVLGSFVSFIVMSIIYFLPLKEHLVKINLVLVILMGVIFLYCLFYEDITTNVIKSIEIDKINKPFFVISSISYTGTCFNYLYGIENHYVPFIATGIAFLIFIIFLL